MNKNIDFLLISELFTTKYGDLAAPQNRIFRFKPPPRVIPWRKYWLYGENSENPDDEYFEYISGNF